VTFLYIILAAAIVVIDRITKILAETFISDDQVIGVIPELFSFVYTENTGAAFSILSDKTWLLSIVSIAFCVGVVIYWFLKKPQNKMLCISVSLIFAGALGNAIDRIMYGYVIDFIRTDFIDFPVFNVADISITVGAALLMIFVIFFDKENS